MWNPLALIRNRELCRFRLGQVSAESNPTGLQHWASNFPWGHLISLPVTVTCIFRFPRGEANHNPEISRTCTVSPHCPWGTGLVHLGCRNNTHTSDFKDLKLFPPVLETVRTRLRCCRVGRYLRPLFLTCRWFPPAQIPLPPPHPMVFSLCTYSEL